jgi:hypothetical protein
MQAEFVGHFADARGLRQSLSATSTVRLVVNRGPGISQFTELPIPEKTFRLNIAFESAARYLSVVGELSGDTRHKELSDSRPCRRRGGSVVRCDGLEGLRFARTIGNASRHARGLRGRAGDKLQPPASSVAVWIDFPPRDDLNAFEELLSLRHRKTDDQPSEGRQKSVPVAGL